MHQSKRFLFSGWLCIAIAVSAQEQLQRADIDTIRTTTIYLESSQTLSFDEKRLPDAQILKGDVCFRHDSARMYCDSAYFFEKSNSLYAFGKVHMVQGDSIEGFGQFLSYDGNKRMARFRNQVRLIHRKLIISTDSLNYDRQKNIAYYFAGGKIIDSLNTLTSKWGQYNPDTYQAIFRNQVVLTNSRFTLQADTLWYNTHSYQTNLVGPTRIEYDTTTTILSTKGWYNTQSEKSMLLHQSRILHRDGHTLTADTIYYDKKQGYGHCYGAIESVDSTHHLTLYGNHSEVWEHPSRGYVTDSALLVDWSDTILSYIHADTLFTEEIPYRISSIITHPVDTTNVAQAPDTIWIDTSYQQVRAFYFVRIYRTDMQAICDSMRYNGRYSILSLYGTPICWNKANQVSSDSIHIYTKNGEIDYLHGIGNALAVKQENITMFDQMGGKEMVAYMKDGDIRLVEVKGNAETIFYPREDNGDFIGVNRTQSSMVKLYIENRQIHHVVFTPATSGILYPIDQVTETQARLNYFFWEEKCRPHFPMDVLRHVERTIQLIENSMSAASEEEETTEILSGRTPKTKTEKRKK